jgi:hypothetical protein
MRSMLLPAAVCVTGGLGGYIPANAIAAATARVTGGPRGMPPLCDRCQRCTRNRRAKGYKPEFDVCPGWFARPSLVFSVTPPLAGGLLNYLFSLLLPSIAQSIGWDDRGLIPRINTCLLYLGHCCTHWSFIVLYGTVLE